MNSDDKNETNLEATLETGIEPSEELSADTAAGDSDPTGAIDAAATTDVANVASSETDTPPLEETSAEPNLDGEEGSADALNGAPAQDSGELSTKEAEAEESVSISGIDDEWRQEIKRFYRVVDAVLTEKEDLRLQWTGKKVPNEFVAVWKGESNKAFRLAVSLRRRRGSGKFGGKIIA